MWIAIPKVGKCLLRVTENHKEHIHGKILKDAITSAHD